MAFRRPPRLQHPFCVSVHCPSCHVEMTRNAKYPENTYCCPGCGGCVNVKLHVDVELRYTCGGLVNGVTCGGWVDYGQTVCVSCQERSAREFNATASGAEVLGRLVAEARILHEKRKLEHQQQAEASRRRQDAARARRASAVHVVYYARLGANHIKIGTTGDLRRRMVELRVVNESNLLAVEPGDRQVEQARHEQFRKWRYSRVKEDFAEAPDLLAHIAAVRAEHGDPYQASARLLVETGLPQQDVLA